MHSFLYIYIYMRSEVDCGRHITIEQATMRGIREHAHWCPCNDDEGGIVHPRGSLAVSHAADTFIRRRRVRRPRGSSRRPATQLSYPAPDAGTPPAYRSATS